MASKVIVPTEKDPVPVIVSESDVFYIFVPPFSTLSKNLLIQGSNYMDQGDVFPNLKVGFMMHHIGWNLSPVTSGGYGQYLSLAPSCIARYQPKQLVDGLVPFSLH